MHIARIVQLLALPRIALTSASVERGSICIRSSAKTYLAYSEKISFAVGALVSGFAAILVINVVNPDALIARTNLNRPNLDLPYLMQLSDDATPVPDAAPLPPAPRASARKMTLAQFDAEIERWQNEKESQSELGEELTLRMQSAIDRRSKAYSMLSNMLKQWATTREGIIANIK